MPKTNDATGATYAGYEGVVEHAGGFGSTRPGGLSQIDPSREVDGSVVEGFESEEREIEEREGAVGADFGEIHPADADQQSEDEQQEAQDSDAGRTDEQRTAAADTSADSTDDQQRDKQLAAAQTGDEGGDAPSGGNSSSGSSRTRASSATRSSKQSR